MKKIYQKMMVLLDARQKKQMVFIVIMMLLGGVLETAGIAMLLPAMTTVIDPDAVSKSEKLSLVYNILGCHSNKQFAIIMFITLIAVFVIKNIVLFFINVIQLRFVYTNQFATSRRMMINFMQRPYEYYLNADTSVIQRNITYTQ